MFGKKKKAEPSVFDKLHHQRLSYFSVRDNKTYRERVIGRDGVINIADGEMVIVCQNKEVFRRPTAVLQIATLMSNDGFTIRDTSDPDFEVITAYYTK